MEYIEPKPVEVDKKKKTRKKVIAGVTCGLLAAGLAVGAFFLVSKVFIEYNHIDLYTFKFDDSDPTSGATISAVKESAELPKKLRLPSKYKKHPIIAIEDSVFLERKEIHEIILPDSIESIGKECFLGCENLSTINVPKNLETIGTDAFTRTAWYESFPSGDIVQFGAFLYSFKGQMAPHSAVLADHSSPKASEYSGNKVYLADFTHYSQGVFKDQKNLEYAELPTTMSGVPTSFFEGCTALEDINLPSSLASIGDYSFRNCNQLHINGFNGLAHLSSIGDYALANTKLSGDIVFNNTIGEVGEGVFSGCTSLTSVTIGDEFRNIPNEFVSGCTSLTALNLPTREHTIQSRIAFIGEHALSQTKITEFRIPFNVSTVRNGAFKECDLLTTVYAYQNLDGSFLNRYDTETKQWVTSDSAIQGIQAIEKECFKDAPIFKGLVLVNANNTEISSAVEVNFPKTLSYLGSINERSDLFTGTNVNYINFADTKISTIAPNLCEDATNLSAVNFGYSSITKFNVEAFKGCVNLTSVIIPDSVKTIEAGLFEGCVNLASVRLSKNTTTIPDFAFKNCSSLTSIRIPLGYKGFGKETFAGCSSLASVIFEENIYNKSQVFANIGQGCFDGCSSLASIVIPNACKQYASEVLKGTTSLATVTLSNKSTLSTVGESMFENSHIESIYLTSNYSTIGKNAFKNSSLKTITMARATPVKVNSNAFSGVTLEHIYVPDSAVEDYKAASFWLDYASIIEPAAECTITFLKGTYGSGTTDPMSELEHGFVALPANGFTSEDDNKVFKCWDIGGSQYQPGEIIPVSGDMTVTAIWEDAVSATISYAANGGTGTMASDTANVGESFELPECTFTREGFEFGGWMVDGETMLHDSGDIITITGNIEARPYWVAKDDSGDTPVDPEEGDDDSGTASKEEEAKKFPVAAIIIIAIAGTAVVGLALFYIIRAIVVKKIYG